MSERNISRNNSTNTSRPWLKREDGRRGGVGKELREHYLELGQALDGLQGPQHPEHPQRLDGLDVPPLVGSAGEKPPGNHRTEGETSDIHITALTTGKKGREAGKRPELGPEIPQNMLWETFQGTPQCPHTHIHTHPCILHRGTHRHTCTHTEASMHIH